MATVLCGDAIEMLRTLPGESVDAVVTSPPYAMQRAKQYGGVPEGEYPGWTVEWMRSLRHALEPKASVLINIREHIRDGEMSDYVHKTRLALRSDGWVECDELVWHKPDAPPVGHPGRPRRSWERVLWFSLDRQPWCDPKASGKPSRLVGMTGGRRNSSGWVNGYRSATEGVARCSDVVSARVSNIPACIEHPAMYPEDFAEWMIRLVCPSGGTVLDPFAGSGTTLRVAERLQREAVGIELNPAYVDLIHKRLSGNQMQLADL